MKNKTKQCVVYFVLCLGLYNMVTPAKAALTFYTDRDAWAAAAGISGDIVTEDFNEVAPYYLADGVNNAGQIKIELVNISNANEFNFIDDGLAWSGWTPFFQGNLHRNDPDAVINLILPSPVNAFGGDFTSTHSSDGLTLQVNGLQSVFEELIPSGDGSGFLGFISTDTFSTVTLYDSVKVAWRLGETFGLDNVSFVAVPEPATMILLGLGGFILRKRGKV